MACPTAPRVGTGGATIASLCPVRPFRIGSRLGGKKAQARMATAVLDWAWADLAGSVAADALYAGPFGMLSAVDHRRSKRLLSDVLAHDPPHEDIRALLGRWHTAVVARGLTPSAGSPRMARHSSLHPSGRGAGRCGIPSASFLSAP